MRIGAIYGAALTILTCNDARGVCNTFAEVQVGQTILLLGVGELVVVAEAEIERKVAVHAEVVLKEPRSLVGLQQELSIAIDDGRYGCLVAGAPSTPRDSNKSFKHLISLANSKSSR